MVGRLPYVLSRRLGLKAIVTPPFTPALGPWIDTGSGAYTKRLGNEMQIMGELLDALPPVNAHYQLLAPALTSAMALHWRGYTISPRYTYRIEGPLDAEEMWKGLQSATRGTVRRAEKAYTVRTEGDAEALVRLSRESLDRAGAAGALELDLVGRISAVAGERGQGELLVAEDAEGRIDAALYIVWDRRCLYQLVAGERSEARGGGGPGLLVWEAMKRAAERSDAFDFEGSMLPGVEGFYRRFGGVQTQYLSIAKVARWIAPLTALRRAVRGA